MRVPNGEARYQPAHSIRYQLPLERLDGHRIRGAVAIVQAPFRIYYAYNVHRLHQTITAQPPFIEPSEIQFLKNTLDPIDPNIFKFQVAPQINLIQNNPGQLNYFEPATTFRFTVSRTF